MYSLLLLSLLRYTTSTVHTVMPDRHCNSNTTCYNLQYYLLNTTKYFTSNTQLVFLRGWHSLDTDLIIQNVHNISLIGSTSERGRPLTAISSDNSSFILLINVTLLTINNILIPISSSEVLYTLPNWTPLTIKDCSTVLLNNIQIYEPLQIEKPHYKFALVAVNIMGNSHFSHLKFYYAALQLFYNETYTNRKYHFLSIDNCNMTTIKLDMLQDSYRVTLKIINTRLKYTIDKASAGINDSFIFAEELGANEVLLVNCQFIENDYRHQLFLFTSTKNGSVQFINCQFMNNLNLHNLMYTTLHKTMQIGPRRYIKPTLIKIYLNVRLLFKDCYFHAKSEHDVQVLQANGSRTNPASVVIKNTTFSYYTNITNPYKDWFITTTLDMSLILLSNCTLLLQDLVIFNNVSTPNSIISLKDNSTIIISGAVVFSHNHGQSLINFINNNIKYIILKENSIVNVTNNDVLSLFATKLTIERYPYPYCLFQYFSNDTSIVSMEQRNFAIRFYNNKCQQPLTSGCYANIPVTNCLWLPQSLFNNSIPLEVNNHYIQFINHNLSQIIEQSSLCVCTNGSHYDCHIYDLGYLYPGQTLSISFYHQKPGGANAVVVKTDITQQYVTPCIVLNISENLQLIDGQCSKLHYTIGFYTEERCELFLKIASDSDDYLNIFAIKQITCPTGFAKIDRRCQCDPVLVQYGITSCNINDQTILRPANSWITAKTHNNSYNYDISLHCPFHYCLSHSSHFNFSSPNSQCQFNRCGELCGQCQDGLSTVFSSFQCTKCPSIYLLLILPIAVAGLILVLMLFVLNLTVTDGTINGFILYANIISINTPVFFTELNHFSLAYTFISLANLDLGIQTCFYNGMDDYAKMWLQLAFPFYLIFIATLIIMASRYSTTIQRLTARRALSVLATLFLLSYTKILRIVSSVLFFYSTITHLPSKHTTLVWSVDANVPLFGVRLTILFIVCLILFLILIPFNTLLLFTRTLSRFRMVNKFKPLLDAYQGPYKNKVYYWTGLQLLMRVVFFGISSLDRNINLTVSIIMFGILGGLHGIVRPFKKKYKNYQELLLMLNLQILYAISQYTPDTNTITIMVTITAVQFMIIVAYHVITYLYPAVISYNLRLSINTLTRWINRSHKRSHQQFQLQDSTRDNIPKVAFNYHEFREPLVGQEYNSHAM